MLETCVILSALVARSGVPQMLFASLAQNWYLAFAILGTALFWVGLHYWNRYRDQLVWPTQKPQPLFLELCETHRLSRPQRALLLKAAETNGLRHSAAIFVDPQFLGRLASAAGPEQGTYQELLEQLFGKIEKA
jgi:hypothetical protein